MLTRPISVAARDRIKSPQSQEARFLRDLNSEIQRQIGAVASGDLSLRPVPIPIPLQLTIPSTDQPEKLLDAEVRLQFEDNSVLENKTIEFSVVHPFVGVLWRDQSCATVDMRRSDAVENLQRYTTTCDGSSNCQHSSVNPKDIFSKENAALVALPLHAQYVMDVRVRSAATETVPILYRVSLKLAFVR